MPNNVKTTQTQMADTGQQVTAGPQRPYDWQPPSVEQIRQTGGVAQEYDKSRDAAALREQLTARQKQQEAARQRQQQAAEFRQQHGATFDESTIADAGSRVPGTPLEKPTSYRPTGSSGSSGGGAAGEATSFESQENLPWAEADRIGHVSTDDKESLLEQIRAAQEQQSRQKIDYAVQQGVDQLTRAQEDAASQYQTMRDQIAADEARALDNQALYAEARGDRGGIGQSQYGAIQNTAATNQLTVNKEQTKLATDIARQIADLRAQGEFQKADELLSLTQSYMSQLMQLKQWADQMNISVDEFNVGVQQWEQEYNMKVRQTLAEAAQQMIAAGATPTEQQLQALGWTPKQYDQYKSLLAAAKSSGGGGRRDTFLQELQAAVEGGLAKEAALQAIRQAEISELHDPGMIQQAYAWIDRGSQKGDNYFGTIEAP